MTSPAALTIVPDDLYADADFRAQRVKGFAGCNTYDALYWANGRQLLVSMAATTLMACADPAGSFETAYLALLDQSRYFNIRLDTLTIRGADGTILLVFDAAPNNPLLGSWIVDSYASAPGAITAPLEGTELTAVFRLANVGGSSGCNTYDGPYSTNGSVAAIGPLATTRMACADDVMAQEISFLKALQGVGKIELRAQTVLLQDLGGSLLVALRRPAAEVTASPSASAAASASPGRTLTPATPSPSLAPRRARRRRRPRHPLRPRHRRRLRPRRRRRHRPSNRPRPSRRPRTAP